MKYLLPLISILILVGATCHAEEKRQGPNAIEVKIETGTKDGQLVFVPDNLRFERGLYYKLVIHNPSAEDHYFSSDEFSTHIFTRKVEALDGHGNTIVEIHGNVHDIELKPGATVEWYFYPMTKGQNLKLFCHKENHEEKGMVGKIEIFGPPPFNK